MTVSGHTYFPVGEFANFFGVSKQTLLYYERAGIFAPAFIDTNGYRYYSVKQYFLFEILLTFRMLGVPMKKISWYLAHRSLENLRQMYEEKRGEIDRDLEILRANRALLEEKLERLEEIETLPIGKPLLENKKAQRVAISPFPHDASSPAHYVNRIAEHNRHFFEGHVIKEHLTGYILDRERLIRGEYLPMSRLFTPITHESDALPLSWKPAGLYATLYQKSGYHLKYIDALKTLKAFMDRNCLVYAGDAYISPIVNYWAAEKAEDYITRVSVRVDYGDC